MSKKLATGAQKIVLDVKYGSGAFMKIPQDAQLLAQTMVQIGKDLDRDTVAVISKMEQPLGYAIGNALEVIEAIQILKGYGEGDLTQLCIQLAGELIFLGGKSETAAQGCQLAQSLINNRKAYEKLTALVSQQGGDLTYLEDEGRLLQAQASMNIFSQQSGIIHHIDAEKIGQFSMGLGAGRLRKEDPIDLSAGITLQKKVGAEVSAGDLLATLYYNSSYQHEADQVAKVFLEAYTIAVEDYTRENLILDTIS